jgi:nucleotide-binding universal stress UspA family protein
MNSASGKIVLAVDGPSVSRLAARQAIEFSQSSGSELHAVHVGLLSRWLHPETLSAVQYQRLKDEAQKRLEAEVEQIEQAGGTVAQAHLRMGRVDSSVISLSEDLGARLIVIGARGKGSLARIVHGSDAERLVRHAPCAVLVVRETTSGRAGRGRTPVRPGGAPPGSTEAAWKTAHPPPA